MKKVGVILVNYNGEVYIRDCIDIKKGNKLKHRLLPFNIVRANGQMLLQKFQTHKSKV